MSVRLALVAGLLGVVIGAGIGVTQEALFPSSVAAGAPGASDGTQAGANAGVAPTEVVIRVNPPRSVGPRFAGLLDAIDAGHKGYVTMDDIKAYYEARRVAGRADAASVSAR